MSANNSALVLKILRGTPKHDTQPLCNSCAHAQIVQGFSESQQYVHCGWFNERVRWPVANCSCYYDKALPDLRDMKDVAWVLATKKGGRDIGFMSAKEYRKQREAMGDDPLDD